MLECFLKRQCFNLKEQLKWGFVGGAVKVDKEAGVRVGVGK